VILHLEHQHLVDIGLLVVAVLVVIILHQLQIEMVKVVLEVAVVVSQLTPHQPSKKVIMR
tara:strand:- start:112 stop:291 length:180 start_codon:yes stop_codon:yes gene_type:complete